MINQIQYLSMIRLPDCFTDEFTQFKYLPSCKDRGFRCIQVISWIIHRITVFSDVVVQIGTWSKMNVFILYFCIIVTDQLRIGPCLIGWVYNLSHCSTGIGFHKGFGMFNSIHLFPLLELNNNHTRMMVFIIAGNHEIDTLGSLRNVIFNRNTTIFRNLLIS